MPPQRTLRRGKLLQGRYRIEGELGRGGFGAVYQAWDNNLQRWCAVKENRETGSEAQRQFLREATVLANLSHPNLPRVVDHFFIPNQGQYLVMDFVEGDDLATICERGDKLDCTQCLQWILQVADALEYLHSLEPPVIHRDIKPSNIRITPKGQAVLVDFGLVKVTQSTTATTIGARAFTPGYSPPEQYGGGSTDVRTDVYALSATLYRLLSGVEPPESIQRLSGVGVTDLSRLNPGVPQSLGRELEKGMHLDPRQRFQSMHELKRSLAAVLAGQVQPRQAPVVPRTILAPEYQSSEYQLPLVQPAGTGNSSTQAAARTGGMSQLVLFGGAAVVIAVLLVVSLAAGGWWVVHNNNTRRTSTALAVLQSTQAERSRLETSTAQVFTTQTSAAGTALAGVQATQTAQAQASATALLQVTEAARATDAFFSSLLSQRQVVQRPESGSLKHDPQDGEVSLDWEDVDLLDFMVEAIFINPYGASEGLWAYGFLFTLTDKDQYRVVIDSKSNYHLVQMMKAGETIDDHLEKEQDSRIGTGDWDENQVAFLRKSGRGWLFINDVMVAEFDLSSWAGVDWVAIGSGFFYDSEISGKFTEYEDFAIWSLP